jgi:hypothetical protein
MIFLVSPVAIGVNKLVGHLNLELLGNPLHIRNGENPLVTNLQAWFGHLAGRQEVGDLVGLTPQKAGDLPQEKILCALHEGIYTACSFFRDKKWLWR